MTRWSAKYTPEQRQAIERTYCEVRVRSAARIAAMAKRGELHADPDASPLPAFEIPPSSVYSIARAGERRRAGKTLAPDLAKLPARDRAQTLQLRLAAVADSELAYMERLQARKKREPLDWEQIRRAGRALRELATIPDPTDKRIPLTPGHRDAPEGTTRDSLAGKLLAASDASMAPSVRQVTIQREETRINADGERAMAENANSAREHENANGHENGDQDDGPGSDEHASEYASAPALTAAG